MNTFMLFAVDTEVAGDVISGESVSTTECYALLNFEVASDSNFQENQNQPIT